MPTRGDSESCRRHVCGVGHGTTVDDIAFGKNLHKVMTCFRKNGCYGHLQTY
jgi:hypothetical protein